MKSSLVHIFVLVSFLQRGKSTSTIDTRKQRICALDDPSCWKGEHYGATSNGGTPSIFGTVRSIRRGATIGYASAWIFGKDSQNPELSILIAAHRLGSMRALRMGTFAALATGIPASLQGASSGAQKRWHYSAGMAIALPVATIRSEWLVTDQFGLTPAGAAIVSQRALMGALFGILLPVVTDGLRNRRTEREANISQRILRRAGDLGAASG